jgi:hypothetical protein
VVHPPESLHPPDPEPRAQARAVARAPEFQSRSAVRILEPEVEIEVERAAIVDSEATEPAAGETAPERGASSIASDTGPRQRVLGVNIADGSAYLAVLDDDGSLRLELADRVVPPREGSDADRLAGFAADIGGLLRIADVGVVAVARPERYSNWTYTDAFERISLETCIVLQAQAQGVRYESVGMNHAANVVGLPLARVSERLAGRLGIRKTRSWPDRWPALLVALATRPG